MNIAVLCDYEVQFEDFYDELLKETKHREQSMHYSDDTIKTEHDTYHRITTTSELHCRAFDTIIDRRVLSCELVRRFNVPCEEQIIMWKLYKFKESE